MTGDPGLRGNSTITLPRTADAITSDKPAGGDATYEASITAYLGVDSCVGIVIGLPEKYALTQLGSKTFSPADVCFKSQFAACR